MGRSPEMPCGQSPDWARRRAGSSPTTAAASVGVEDVAGQTLEVGRLVGASTPRWRSCTCAWVQASVAGPLEGVAVVMLVEQVEQLGARRRDARSRRRRAPSSPGATAHAAAQREDRVEHRARRCSTAAGRRAWRAARAGCGPRPMKRARSVSILRVAGDLAFDHGEMRGPDLAARSASAGAASRAARRTRGRYSVWTNIFEKAGCALSAAGGRQHELGIGCQLDLARRGGRCSRSSTRRTSASSSRRDQHLQRRGERAVAADDTRRGPR